MGGGLAGEIHACMHELAIAYLSWPKRIRYENLRARDADARQLVQCRRTYALRRRRVKNKEIQ